MPVMDRQVWNEGHVGFCEAERLFIMRGALEPETGWKAPVTLAREVCVVKFHHSLVALVLSFQNLFCFSKQVILCL